MLAAFYILQPKIGVFLQPRVHRGPNPENFWSTLARNGTIRSTVFQSSPVNAVCKANQTTPLDNVRILVIQIVAHVYFVILILPFSWDTSTSVSSTPVTFSQTVNYNIKQPMKNGAVNCHNRISKHLELTIMYHIL